MTEQASPEAAASEESQPVSEKANTLRIAFFGELGWTTFAVTSALLANSVSLWANAARVGLEMVLCFLALYGTLRLEKGDDHAFDYGLGKLENLFSLIGGLVVLGSFFFVSWQAVERFLTPHPTEGALLGIVVLLGATTFNVWMYLRLRNHLRAEASPILFTQCQIYRNATLASAITLFSVLLPTLFPGVSALHYLDPAGALILCLFLLQTGITLVRGALFHLLDGTLEEAVQLEIVKGLARHFDDYEQLRRVRSRRSGSQVFVELFLEFDPELRHGEVLHRAAQLKQTMERAIPSAVVWVVPVGREWRKPA